MFVVLEDLEVVGITRLGFVQVLAAARKIFFFFFFPSFFSLRLQPASNNDSDCEDGDDGDGETAARARGRLREEARCSLTSKDQLGMAVCFDRASSRG